MTVLRYCRLSRREPFIPGFELSAADLLSVSAFTCNLTQDDAYSACVQLTKGVN